MSNNGWFHKVSLRDGIVTNSLVCLVMVLYLGLFTYASATIFARFGLFGYPLPQTKVMQSTRDFHVSANMPVGTVVSEPQDLGEGLFLVQIQMDSGNPDKLKRYPAVTAHPEQFPIGSKATLRNVTASGDYTFGDMFHIAVKSGS